MRWGEADLYVQPDQIELPVVGNGKQVGVRWKTFFSDCNNYVLGRQPAGVIRRASQDRLLNIARENNNQNPGGMLVAAHS